MKISVKTVTGKTIAMEVEPSDTGWMFLAKVDAVDGASSGYRLACNGKSMDTSEQFRRTLGSSFGIQEEDTIHLCLRCGGPRYSEMYWEKREVEFNQARDILKNGGEPTQESDQEGSINIYSKILAGRCDGKKPNELWEERKEEFTDNYCNYTVPTKEPRLVHCNRFLSLEKVPGKNERRIFKEIEKFVGKSNEEKNGIHIYVDKEDWFQLKVLLEGPMGTPFEGGVFLVDIRLPSNYPFSCRSPKVHFRTPIFHCNVSNSGEVGLDFLFGFRWGPHHTILEILTGIQDFLANPNLDEAISLSIAELTFAHLHSGDTSMGYVEQAKAATLEAASRTVEEWEALWGIASNN